MRKSHEKDLRLDKQRVSFTFNVAVGKICYNFHPKKSILEIDSRERRSDI